MIGPLIRLMRPGDWVKNVFIFPALVFSGAWTDDPYAILYTVIAFVAFCLLASSVYATNDVLDAPKDRQHPVKRRRPVASGQVLPHVALGLAAVLATIGLGAGFWVNVNLGLTLVLYVLLQAAYNAGLKRILVVDVVCLAIGFALRAAAGAVAINVAISPWLLLCVFFLCVYLGFIKRLCDIASAEAEGDVSSGAVKWTPAADYSDRHELNWLLCVSAGLAVVTYLMYALSGHTYQLFGPRAVGFALMTPIVLIAIHRFYHRATTGASDSPLAALIQDRAVLICVLLFSAGVLAVLYIKPIDGMLEEVFFFGEAANQP